MCLVREEIIFKNFFVTTVNPSGRCVPSLFKIVSYVRNDILTFKKKFFTRNRYNARTHQRKNNYPKGRTMNKEQPQLIPKFIKVKKNVM